MVWDELCVAGVVDEDVKLAEGLEGRLDHSDAFGLAAYVGAVVAGGFTQLGSQHFSGLH